MSILPLRAGLLISAMLGLVAGIEAGLARLGIQVPPFGTDAAAWHGPLLLCGFLGTLISLERAVALATAWAYLAPLAAAMGGIALLAGGHATAAALCMTLAGALLSTASILIYLRQRALFTLTLTLGGVCWTVGNLLWLDGFSIARIVPWWAGFLVLTIAGERLELSRMLPPSAAARAVFVVVTVLLLVGAVLAAAGNPPPMALFSAGLLSIAVWLLRQDIARRTIRQTGLTRYIASCLLSGYVWLLAAGLIGMLAPTLAAGSSYDAFLHALFVGFVFSMIFGHAPIIFPAVARLKVPYHPTFYIPLLLLHGSLAVRIAGDLLGSQPVRSLGGAFNALAVALFVLSTVAAVMRGRRSA